MKFLSRRAPRAALRVLLASALWPLPPASVRAATDACSAGYLTNELRDETPLAREGARLQAVNVFAFEFDGECRLVAQSPWVSEEALRLKDDPQRLVMVDVRNEIQPGPGTCRSLTPGQMVHRFLSDPARRAAHIKDIVAVGALARGVEIDYEALLPETKPFMTDFMRELRAALPPEKRLAAVVQPKTRNGGGGGVNIDWRGILPFVDYLRVMAYYYAWNTSPPGPVVTYAKLGELADYILNDPSQSVPREKARIMLSLYGWDWPVSPAGPGKLIRYEEAVALLQAHGAVAQRDPQEDTLHFRYQDEAGVTHEVWYDDALGHSKRIQLLLDRGFPAIDLWHLGTGDPALWSWFAARMRADCPSLAAPPAVAAAAVLDRLAVPALPAGGGDAAVTVQGAGLSAADVVLWNGTPHPTSLAGSGALQVTLRAAEVAEPQAGRIAVAQGGRLSNGLTLRIVGNPVLDAFDPPAAPAGASGFTLALRGEGFEPGSQVLWNGQGVPARFVSEGEMQADIGGELLAAPRSVRVGVVNPTSGARISRFYDVGVGLASNRRQDSSVRAGPNPWSAARHDGGVRFFGLASAGEVAIYAASGRLLKNLSFSNAAAEWDLTDESGAAVSSGLYFFVADGKAGPRQRGAFTVIR